MPWSNPLTEMILSGVAATRDAKSVAHAAAATKGFEAADMALHAATARRRHGELIGGDEGKTLIEATDTWMRSEKIKNPQRFTALFAPGFRGDD